MEKRNVTIRGRERKDCREPKGMGPIEIALRNAPYRVWNQESYKGNQQERVPYQPGATLLMFGDGN